MNLYLINILYILTTLLVITIYRTMYGWKFVIFSEYPFMYILLYILVLGLPLVYNVYKFVQTKNDESYESEITKSKWMGVLFITLFVIAFNIFVRRSFTHSN